jgi:alkaline phosphatase D
MGYILKSIIDVMAPRRHQRGEVSLADVARRDQSPKRLFALLFGLITISSSVIGFVVPVGAAAGTPAPVTSTFDTDADGWVTLNDGSLSYVATGGNPGGHLFASDLGQGSWWYFQAPNKYIGDKSAYIGGTLSFDAKQSGGAFNDAPTYGDIVLLGTNGVALAYNFDTPHGTAWAGFEATLVASDWTVATVGTAGGLVTYTQSSVAPTDAEFEAVLSDVAALYVRGEYRSGSDSSGLDNVVLAPAPGSRAAVSGSSLSIRRPA